MNAIRTMCREIMSSPPVTTDVAGFCERLGERRRRPIVLLPFTATTDSPSGIWVKGDQRDYVFFDQTTSAVQQEAIIWHEVAHLLLDHPGPAVDPEQSRLLLPDLDPAIVLRMLSRHAYGTSVEREAERLASFLMIDHAHLRRTPADGLTHRLSALLHYRDGRG